MQTRVEPGHADPGEFALTALAALPGGLLLTRMQRSTKPPGTALDAMLGLIVREAGRLGGA